MKYFYSLIRFTKEILKIVIFIISILFSGYFILGTIYSTIFIELQFKEKIISSMLNRELMLILFGILGVLGVLGFRKIAKPILSKGEIIIYLFSSYFLSYFIVKNFQFPGQLFIILILFISVIIFFLLLQTTDFFYNFNVLYLKELILKEKIKLGKNISQFIFNFNNIFLRLPKTITEVIQRSKKIIFNKELVIEMIGYSLRIFLRLPKTIMEIIQGSKKIIPNKESIIKIIGYSFRLIISMAFSLAIFLGVIILTIGLTGLIIFKINQYFDYQNQLRKSFVITKIVPKNTTYAQEIVLQGYNFGWRLNAPSQLMTKDGAINDIKLWTDNEIRFIVPLHLKEGKSVIWLERPEDDSSHSAILRSNQVLLNIISRWEFYLSQENYDKFFYPIQRENLLKRIKRFLFFKLKVGDLFSY